MTRLYILTAAGIVGPLAIGASAWLIKRAGILDPLKKRGYFGRSPHLWEWHPHDTATDTFMRRRRWYGWQTRAMTQEELRAHVESRLSCWLGRPEISDASGPLPGYPKCQE
jgi:hypothetical protein